MTRRATEAEETQFEPSVPTHRVTYKGESVLCNAATFDSQVGSLVKRLGAGGGVPDVEELPLTGRTVGEREVEALARQPISTVPPSLTMPAAPSAASIPVPVLAGNQAGLAGTLRASADEQLAFDQGFAPPPPMVRLGTAIDPKMGRLAHARQLAFERKPLARDLAASLVKVVQEEDRQDYAPQRLSLLRMDKTGQLVLPGNVRHYATPHAFGASFKPFPCESGVKYLRSCPPKLRAINFNHWAVELGEQEKNTRSTPTQVVLRTRVAQTSTAKTEREVFAVVSSKYTAFDADQIGEALRFAFPDDARGSLDYDGERLRIEGLWQTDVGGKDFVAGEIFKAGVLISTSDVGSGSVRVVSAIWRVICTNLLIVDKSIGVDIRIRHGGNVSAMAREFQKAFRKALTSVDPFRKAWSRAFEERDDALVARAAGTTAENITGRPASEVLPGLFNGILQRELVRVPGRKPDTVQKLMELHSQDEAAPAYGVSRASIINAFTRYAHVVESDPFVADEIREGAGRLLSARAGHNPAPLPYVTTDVRS